MKTVSIHAVKDILGDWTGQEIFSCIVQTNTTWLFSTLSLITTAINFIFSIKLNMSSPTSFLVCLVTFLKVCGTADSRSNICDIHRGEYGKTVDCSSRLQNYTTVPWGDLIPLDTRVLLLQGNGLDERRLTGEDFENLKNIQTLDLSHNRFECLPLESLSNLKVLRATNNLLRGASVLDLNRIPGLMDVDLSSNQLQTWSTKSPLICRSPQSENNTDGNDTELVYSSVQRLDLHENLLDDGALRNLSQFTNLTFLDLSSNRITLVSPSDFPSLALLGTLKLDDNIIYQVTFPPLERVENISIQGNLLEYIGLHSFSSLHNLIHLDLSYNKIGDIPRGAFNSTSRLFSLQLQGNRLGQVRHGYIFSGLSQLDFLELSYNDISDIPSGFFKGLSNLHDLRLDFNSLTVLESNSFIDVPTVANVSLQGNRLRTISNEFRTLTDTVHLNLQGNQISNISETAFETLSMLIVINLDGNQLQHVPHAFGGVLVRKGLQELALSHNYIQSIDQYDFPRLSRLETLDLGHNAIREIHPGSFTGLTSLTHLSLNNNELSHILPGTLSRLSSLSEIKLYDNHWSCDCKKLWPLWEYYDRAETNFSMADSISCTSETDFVPRPITLWESYLNETCRDVEVEPPPEDSSFPLKTLLVTLVVTLVPIVFLLIACVIVMKIRLQRRGGPIDESDLRTPQSPCPPPPVKRVDSEGAYEVPFQKGSNSLYYSQPYAHIDQQVILQVGSVGDAQYVNHAAVAINNAS